MYSHLRSQSIRFTPQVELGWGNGKVEDIFFIAGYHLEGSVVSQVNGYFLISK